MMNLDGTGILCVVLTFLPLAWGFTLEIGLCTDWMVACQCGDSPGFTFHVGIRQCPHIVRWNAECRPCKNTDERALCDQYRHCLDCAPTYEGCIRCPPKRSGRWCQQECDCQNGGWCNEAGTCVCPTGFHGNNCEKGVECQLPHLTENITVHPHANTYLFGTQINFQCRDGFFLEGNNEAKCLEGGRWSRIAPVCLPLCPYLPKPQHGSANIPLGRIVPGTIIQFTCNQGFILSGPSARRCQENGVWSRTQPICVPSVECPQPTIPENIIVLNLSSKSPFSPGSTLSFQCKEGLVLVGKETMKCEQAGKWSTLPAMCVREDETCHYLGPLQDGNIEVEDGVYGRHIHVIGTRLLFSCKPLHLLVGSIQAICQGNGTWSASLPTCLKVPTCSALDSLSNGFIQLLKPDAAIPSVRSFSLSSSPVNTNLRPSKSSRFRSQADGLQSFQQGGSPMVLPEGFFHVGTQATFECESRYYKLHGSSIRTCTASGEWSGRPSSCTPACGRSSDPLTPSITHGAPSDAGQWPWIVGVSRLTLDDEYILHCGASLLDERWVITAAHCVTFEHRNTLVPLNELQFYAGKYFWNNSLDDNEVQVRKADAVYVHPDFDPIFLDSDIALVRLSQPVRLSSRVQTVCLPSDDPIESQERLKDGSLGVMIGWGKTEKANYSDVLLHAQLPVVSTTTCSQSYKQSGASLRITSNMFCAGYETGKHDGCNGDSGGPFVFSADATASRYILEGIASWGSPQGCGLEKQYGGYVRVQKFVNWIHNFV